MKQYPIFINCRDRVEPLRQQIAWLEKAGYERIYLIDNQSTYEPLLEFYRQTPHYVRRLNSNQGHTAVWTSGIIEEVAPNEFYCLTDPDIVPVEECPDDCNEYFESVLNQYPKYIKVGFGLKVDDVPDHWLMKEIIMQWERHMWFDEHLIAPGLYYCPIDTTWALYRPGTQYCTWDSLRTGMPYVARHLPWYTDTINPTPEEIYYAQNASGSSTWAAQQLEEWKKYNVNLDIL